MLQKAQSLRKNQTDAEKLLWQSLRNRGLNGYKFRRQHPIHFYFADFYCHELRLIIEVDGNIHLNPEIRNHDKNRTEELSRFGIYILRFTNEEILYSIESVKSRIKQYINTQSNIKAPSP